MQELAETGLQPQPTLDDIEQEWSGTSSNAHVQINGAGPLIPCELALEPAAKRLTIREVLPGAHGGGSDDIGFMDIVKAASDAVSDAVSDARGYIEAASDAVSDAVSDARGYIEDIMENSTDDEQQLAEGEGQERNTSSPRDINDVLRQTQLIQVGSSYRNYLVESHTVGYSVPSVFQSEFLPTVDDVCTCLGCRRHHRYLQNDASGRST